ncbi:MAG: 1-(5-phosphoribosyl)-5-[(5-phosphoribosylamino)methylideneamino]imidazole-4-carboxamide isomerase [Acidimicrobiia bacterium]
MIDLFPAIDLRGGRCVRLRQGDYADETVYGDDPVAQARAFVAEGAPWVHVVDLDAARTGDPVNRPVIRAIAAAVDVPVQTGGGVRTEADADELLGAGVARVVVGSAAVEDPDLVRRLVARHGGAIAVGLDHRDGEVRTRGWTQGSGRRLVEVVAELSTEDLGALVVTDISRDGELVGPDLDGYRDLLARSPVPLVASGGVGTLEDLVALDGLEAGGRRLAGAIVGKAIYEGRFGVAEARARLAGGTS